jgi:hypothetical protein
MPDNTKTNTTRKGKGDHLFQLALVLLGAFIALGSSWLTLRWQDTRQREDVVNHIKGSIQNDLYIYNGWVH